MLRTLARGTSRWAVADDVIRAEEEVWPKPVPVRRVGKAHQVEIIAEAIRAFAIHPDIDAYRVIRRLIDSVRIRGRRESKGRKEKGSDQPHHRFFLHGNPHVNGVRTVKIL